MPASCLRTLYTALAHSLLDSVQLTYGPLPTPLAQFRAHNSRDQRAGAIESA